MVRGPTAGGAGGGAGARYLRPGHVDAVGYHPVVLARGDVEEPLPSGQLVHPPARAPHVGCSEHSEAVRVLLASGPRGGDSEVTTVLDRTDIRTAPVFAIKSIGAKLC